MKKLKQFCILLFACCILLTFGTVVASAAEIATCSACNTGTVTNGICDNASCTLPYQTPELVDDSSSPYHGYYKIENAGHLLRFAELVNGGDLDARAFLANDVDLNPGYTFSMAEGGPALVKKGDEIVSDLSALRQWTPIGTSIGGQQFVGKFEGCDKTVRGIFVNGSEYIGLFGSIGSDGVVSHVKVENSYINGRWYVGGIAGENGGSVSYCAFGGNVFGHGGRTGGVVGLNTGELAFSHNTGTVSGAQEVGGVVGHATASVTNSYNTGAVIGVSKVGGVVGHAQAFVMNSYNAGAVRGESKETTADSVGGVVGYSTGSVANSYNTGTVSGMEGTTLIGAIVGENRGNAWNCYYLTGTASYGIGGSTADTNTSTAAMDATVFRSGRVAWLLNDGDSADRDATLPENPPAWYQSIATNGDPAPVLTPAYDPADPAKIVNTVYRHINGGTCLYPTYGYANTELAHDFVACVHDEVSHHASAFKQTDADTWICSLCGEAAVVKVDYTHGLIFSGLITEYYTVFDNAIGRANGDVNSAVLTLLGDVETDFTVSGRGSIILKLNGYRVTGTVTVAENATLRLGDNPLVNPLKVAGAGAISVDSGFPLSAADLKLLEFVSMAEDDVKAVVNNKVVTGALTVTLDETELPYVGRQTRPTVTVKIGDTPLDETHYTLIWSDDTTNAGGKSVSVVFSDTVQTKAGATVTLPALSWSIVKGTLATENVKATHPYGSDRTTAVVTSIHPILIGEDSGFIVEGAWGAVTYDETTQKYYATFLVDDSQKGNINDLRVELTDESFETTAVDVEGFAVAAPEWLIPDDSLTLSATGVNPHSKKDAIPELKLTYWYKFGNSTWVALSNDALALSATDLNGATTVLLKVTTDELGGKYNPTESEVLTLTVKTTSDVIAKLEGAVEDLNAATTEELEELADRAAALESAMSEAEAAIAKAATKEEAKAIEDAYRAANAALQSALNTLIDRVSGLETQATANKNDIAALSEALRLLKLENKDAELANKDAELANKDAELASMDGKLQAFTLVVCVISGVSLCGSGAFVAWFFLDKKKKLSK